MVASRLVSGRGQSGLALDVLPTSSEASVLRQFPFLSKYLPLCDPRECHHYWLLCLWCMHFAGVKCNPRKHLSQPMVIVPSLVALPSLANVNCVCTVTLLNVV
jgi:hypothetical protein